MCIRDRCSDGVFECHYRRPLTSVTETDLLALAQDATVDPAALTERIMNLAHTGVRGSPGGEDNIAVAVTRV